MSAATSASVAFDAEVIGTYRFSLKVWDSLGMESCADATHDVTVASDEAIHVELVWDTPADPDQTDTGVDIHGASVGSDLDLHFMHPGAGNTWFHAQYDCHAWNPAPEWGAAGEADNPRLFRDDTDGAGPEIVTLSLPESGNTYRVGVHFLDDWGFGRSLATVRVYMYGDLRLEWRRVMLLVNDLSDAATIAWPSMAATRVENSSSEPIIMPNFSNGFQP